MSRVLCFKNMRKRVNSSLVQGERADSACIALVLNKNKLNILFTLEQELCRQTAPSPFACPITLPHFPPCPSTLSLPPPFPFTLFLFPPFPFALSRNGAGVRGRAGSGAGVRGRAGAGAGVRGRVGKWIKGTPNRVQEQRKQGLNSHFGGLC